MTFTTSSQMDTWCSSLQGKRFTKKTSQLGESRGSLGFGLGVCDLADEYGVLRVTDVALLLHVRGGDGEHGSIVVEGQRGDAGRVPVELAQALLVERVPDVDKAIRATW